MDPDLTRSEDPDSGPRKAKKNKKLKVKISF
jgi:hypothetical protein